MMGFIHGYSLALGLLLAIYLGLLAWLWRGFPRLRSGRSRAQPRISVIVAARNEEATIGHCLEALLAQSYPQERYEIIVIDDRSTDGTAQIVRNFAATHPRLRLLQVTERSPLAPKKHAIDLGIRQARGDVIVTTDADCTPAPGWLAELIRYFEPNVGLVAGYNPYRTDGRFASRFHRMLALDYFAMACVAAASAGLGFPISCTGGNLAYRKELYEQLGGFSRKGRWVSGDDDLFLEQVRERTAWCIRYAVHPDTFVPTQPPEDLRAFVHQRIRYASKGGHYARPVTAALTVTYLLHLALVLGLLVAPLAPNLLPVWALAFGVKSACDYAFLGRGARHLRHRLRPGVFLFTALVHPPYIVVAGFLGQVATFRWKGERYAATTRTPSPVSHR